MKILAVHDGGSGSMFYRIRVPLEALAANGYEVTFLSAYNGGGTNTYREPAGYGAGVKMDHRLANEETLKDGFDVVIGHRLGHHAGLEPWRRVRGPFSRLVYETDDDVFSVGPDNWMAYNVFGRGDVQDAVIHASEVSDLVTVSTAPLAKVMGAFNPETLVLGNCLPDWVPDMERRPRRRPCAGWMGGASHGIDVGLTVEAARRFLGKFPGWDFLLYGTDFRPTFAHKRVLWHRWVPVNQNPRGYYSEIRMDIGLAPLSGTTFDQSKSFVKTLEYAGMGVPSVASDAGPYPEFIRHGSNGFLAKTADDWLEYMCLLASDGELRRRMGEQAREDARAWTIGRHWQKWAKAYEGLFPAGWKGHVL